MKNFFLSLIELLTLGLFLFITWLMLKFPYYIVFLYPLLVFNLIILPLINSYFLEILTLILSIFLGIITILLLPNEFYIDKIFLFFEMLGISLCYFTLFRFDREYKEQETLWIEKKENLEKDISSLKINIETLQEEIYSTIIKIQNYKLVNEVINKLSSFNNTKHLVKYITTILKDILPNLRIKFYLSDEEISDDIDLLVIEQCNNEKGLFYVPDTSIWFNEIKKNFKKSVQKSKKSLFCLKLSTSTQQELGYLICYSDEVISEDNIRFLSLLSSYISISLANTKLFERIKELSITDSLTGLYVQKYFKEILNEEIKIAKYYQRDLSLAIFDIDNFKQINDTYGHNIGDEVLIRFADLLRTRLRETDILCRYGGDEFTVLFPNTNHKTAAEICEEIRNTVERETIVISKEFLPKEEFVPSRLKFYVSCGVCGFFKDKFKTADEFLNFADKLLYKAKMSGKNRVIVC
jgi:diguanylate cyclase (GGDEF)-like protein